MKINSIEQEIIKTYINKNKQDRIIWELGNTEKRMQIMLSRFAGPALFKSNCLYPVNYMSSNEMEKAFMELSGVQDVYFIGQSYIGEISLKEAVNRANTGEICIIYCGNGIGYYQGEEDSGKPPRFLLMQKG